MFADQLMADDIVQQVIVYMTLKKPALIHVHCNPDRVDSIWNLVVERWNATKAANIQHIDDLKRYKVEVKFLGLPYKAKSASHSVFTVGKADVIIMEHMK